MKEVAPIYHSKIRELRVLAKVRPETWMEQCDDRPPTIYFRVKCYIIAHASLPGLFRMFLIWWWTKEVSGVGIVRDNVNGQYGDSSNTKL
ncbi:hypothetical protein LOD99_737 [Oopsacas minuta]|uniref:Uncharacterized protein n=1 Tax=Oopsacas minuta TaxID=111878 RepID=A0AAV7K170_9METZ|nr:hypothetical protein LOD99_737 [Oopsacas minuta]